VKAAAPRLECWLLGVAVLVAFAGCGDTDKPTEASPGAKAAAVSQDAPRDAWISIDGYKGAQSVGILMAQELGYFEDEGVQMTITSAAAPDGAIVYVNEELVDFGVTRQPQVVLAREQGVPLVAVGALVALPTAALIWLKKSGIQDIADLKGKKIAIPGLTFQEDFLRSLLERNGLTFNDVKILHAGYELPRILASGQADAIFGGSWNVEGAALAARGLKPVIHRVQSLGLPAFDEQVLVARPDLVAEDGPLVRDVLAAVARGTAAAIEHPRAAVKAIEESDETDPAATPKVTEAEVEATLPLLSETGYMSPGQAEELVDWMHAEGWIKRAFPASRLLTNDYLLIDDR
jgi:putative hydroxymethylpyrimidine transport system substrate-binding protein